MQKYSVTYLIGDRVFRTDVVVESFEAVRPQIARRRGKTVEEIVVISLIMVAVEH